VAQGSHRSTVYRIRRAKRRRGFGKDQIMNLSSIYLAMRLLFPDGDHVRDAQAIGLEIARSDASPYEAALLRRDRISRIRIRRRGGQPGRARSVRLPAAAMRRAGARGPATLQHEIALERIRY